MQNEFRQVKKKKSQKLWSNQIALIEAEIQVNLHERIIINSSKVFTQFELFMTVIKIKKKAIGHAHVAYCRQAYIKLLLTKWYLNATGQTLGDEQIWRHTKLGILDPRPPCQHCPLPMMYSILPSISIDHATYEQWKPPWLATANNNNFSDARWQAQGPKLLEPSIIPWKARNRWRHSSIELTRLWIKKQPYIHN